ncbi:MAG: hypothetical protein ACR2O0_07200 [Rhizobiaceae bacterium]
MQDILSALNAMEAENFTTGKAWEDAHMVAQAHEGTPAYDRLHALCHRIEGDLGNAGYWYRRAGVNVFSGSFAEEKQALEADLNSD